MDDQLAQKKFEAKLTVAITKAILPSFEIMIREVVKATMLIAADMTEEILEEKFGKKDKEND
jgi:hypothetical protein